MRNGLIVLLLILTPLQSWARHDWPEKLQPRLAKIVKEFDGTLGVYVKDLSTGVSFSLYGDVWWYYASTIKLFVLIEVMRQIEAGRLSFEQKITVAKSDYRDGAGRTNWLAAGSTTTLRFLVDQMMIESDNAATDLLIRLVGLETLKENLKTMSDPSRMGEVTTMLDVRRLAYGELHANASQLTNMDFFELKKAKSDAQKLEKFLQLAAVERTELKVQSVNEAFQRYYRRGFNSGTLTEFAAILERLVQGKIINANRSQEILGFMAKCETGQARIRAGLPKNVTWMHKTGTQLERICDMGVVEVPARAAGATSRFVVITVCAKGFKSLSKADRAMKKVAEAMTKTGLFEMRP